MNVVVCVKQVPDPEAPPATFKIDPSTNKVVPPAGVAPVISPFDDQAVEAALRLRDAQGAKVTVLSMGPATAREVIKHALAMGADEGILLDDPAFEDADSYSTALTLAAAIRKIGNIDLVLCGRQAADWDAGQVGSGVAELLGWPCVTVAKKVEAQNGKMRVERVIEDGYEVVEVEAPAVVTVSNELGEPRYATVPRIMAAARKPIPVWTAQELGLEASQVGGAGRRLKLLKLFIPEREGRCEVVEGENAADAAAKLAERLRQEKIL
ncbi:MAG TPA: electron transfer flavoprotein subunit beta/FixA family protein [Dehalococcoidia bacterium]|nr:electron transfer flavoprotein subunit beta/FixA family protein [Dehalococcoidia bacterium]